MTVPDVFPGQARAGVIARAERVVVAGDPKQLPPTSFFSPSGGGIDDEEAEASVDTSLLADVESVLDQVSALLPPSVGTRTLNWHYRSRDERLIAFSNAQATLYDYAMTTFPGVGIDEPVRHLHIPWRDGLPGQADSSADEVTAVVKLIAKHAHSPPSESLGVIAMGIKHANRIEEVLRRERLSDDKLDAFVTGESSPSARSEQFFVKNLERVQGDERDAIILTIGYTKGADGRMQYRFGPLNNEGGERRLNVAVTRARKRMTVVSSFLSADLDPKRLRSEGAKMLGRYLAYAESGGSNLGEAPKDKPELNAFERDVQAQLTKLRRGFLSSPSGGLPATGSTMRPSIPLSLAGWSWPSNATAPRTTPRPLPETGTGSGRSTLSVLAGSSTVSGRPSGSVTAMPRSTVR